MAQSARTSGVLQFSHFQVDLRAGELYKAGRRVKLQVQPFEILAMLLAHPGELVRREELREKLWPADTFVDFEHGLNTAVKKLRQALCDDAKKPQFVETLARRGYRFIGTVEGMAAPVPRVSARTPSWAGQVARLCGDDNLEFVLLPVDEEALQERQKLDFANDDVGLSLLLASQRILMVPTGTQVRVLEVQQEGLRCQVRILDGEHYGKTALAPQENLTGLS
jgi:DNA-binding winged helix-turn-helix (wHTH) protein